MGMKTLLILTLYFNDEGYSFGQIYGEAKTAFKNSTVALPKLVDNDSVLIKVHGFGINFADVMARKGLYSAAPNLPAILGYEVVGVVEKGK